MSIDEQLKLLAPVNADPDVLPPAAALLSERLAQLPVADVSLSELVEKLSKKEGQ